MLQLPFFERLDGAQTILLAGAGGGFDFFCGLPLYRALRDAGKTVYLANLSFSDLDSANNVRFLTDGLVEVSADSFGNELYFPELHFCRWMRGRGEDISVYAFAKTGVVQMTHGYQMLCEMLDVDALVLVDGGTDSLMRGDESGLGTPVEDITSILSASAQDVPLKMLACVGFGVDSFHGVCHAYFLEAVADLIEHGAYLGTWSLLREMPEVEFYREASEFVFRKMPHHPSIVSSSILSAIEGRFGDYHTTARTQNNKLFINPLMALMWCFELGAIADRLLYPATLSQTKSVREVWSVIEHYRESITPRPFEPLPM